MQNKDFSAYVPDIQDDYNSQDPIYVLDQFYLNLFPNVNVNYENPAKIEKLFQRLEQILIQPEDQIKIIGFKNCVHFLLHQITFNGNEKFSLIEEIGSCSKNVMINIKPYLIEYICLINNRWLFINTVESIRKNLLKLLDSSKNDDNNNQFFNSLQLNKFNVKNGSFILTSKLYPNDLKAKIILSLNLNNFDYYGSNALVPAPYPYPPYIQESNWNLPPFQQQQHYGYHYGHHQSDDIIDTNLVQKRLTLLNRYYWYKENCFSSNNFRTLLRLFLDLKSRFKGFQYFDQWIMEVLLNYCITTPPKTNKPHNNNYHDQKFHGIHKQHQRQNLVNDDEQRNSVKLQDAFFRAFQLLSAGILLPDSISINDPTILDDWIPINRSLSDHQLDRITCTSQTLLRIMNYTNGFEIIIGLMKDDRNIEDDVTIWDGIIVEPSIPVTIDHDHGHSEDGDEDDDDNNNRNDNVNDPTNAINDDGGKN